MKKFNNKCAICGEQKGIKACRLHKEFNDIIKECNIKKTVDSLNCRPLWDIENGVALCEKHYNETPIR